MTISEGSAFGPIPATRPDEASDLIIRFAAGDERAYRAFYRLLLPAAHALARSILRDGHLAEDALQEACRKAWTGARGFKPGNGRAWFLTIVRRTCFDIAKGRSRFDVSAADDVARAAGQNQQRLAGDHDTALSGAESEYFAQVVRESWFRQLAPRDQKIVFLSGLGFSNAEIMARLPDVTHNEIIRRALARAARRWREAHGEAA